MKAVVYPWLHTNINDSNKEELLINLNFFFLRGYDTIIIPFAARNGRLQVYVATTLGDDDKAVTLIADPSYFPEPSIIAKILVEHEIAPISPTVFNNESKTVITDKIKDRFINFLIDTEVINRFTNNLIQFRAVNLDIYIQRMIEQERPAESLFRAAFPFDAVPENKDFWAERHFSWLKTLADE